MLPDSLQSSLEFDLSLELDEDLEILSTEAIGGGCIHNASHLKTTHGDFFLKYNAPHEIANFDSEKRGLEVLQAAKALSVPGVVMSGTSESHAFLVLGYIESGIRKSDFWWNFGQGLAALHRNTREDFGLDHDNFIGRLPQRNDTRTDWASFYAEMRLAPQILMAEGKELIDRDLRKKFEQLYPRLEQLMPVEPPSMLHGDLWSGNFMVGPDGQAVVYDPAVYYGHREAELAFTRLFGGYADAFYEAYEAAWPMQAGWSERIDLFNLYPLTVHLNLFGQSYLPEIQRILSKFI